MHAFLHGLVRDQRFRGLSHTRRQQQAPQARHPHEHEPEIRIGDIGDRRQIFEMVLERKFRTGTEPEFRERQAREADPLAYPDDARRPVSRDQVTAFQFFRTFRGLDIQRHPVFVLRRPGCPNPEADIDIIEFLELGDDYPRQLVLLALDPIGMPGIVLENPEVPVRDDALAGIPVLPGRADDPLLQQLVDHAKIIEHIERRRLKCGGAQIFGEIHRRFDKRYRYTAPRKIQGRRTADRPCPGD